MGSSNDLHKLQLGLLFHVVVSIHPEKSLHLRKPTSYLQAVTNCHLYNILRRIPFCPNVIQEIVGFMYFVIEAQLDHLLSEFRVGLITHLTRAIIEFKSWEMIQRNSKSDTLNTFAWSTTSNPDAQLWRQFTACRISPSAVKIIASSPSTVLVT